MSDRALRYSVTSLSRETREEPRAMSPKLTGKITGFFNDLMSSSDTHKCHICNEEIREFDAQMNICKKCGDETCKAHIRMQAITEENKQLMCASCAQMVELETIRLTCIQQKDRLLNLVKERESNRERLRQTEEEHRARILALEKALADAESQGRIQAESCQSDLVLCEDQKRSVLEQLYSLSQTYKEVSAQTHTARETSETLNLQCYCLKQEAEHMQAACEDLSAQIQAENADLKQKVPIANLKKMLCRDCYLRIKSMYKDREDAVDLFSSVVADQTEKPPALEQMTCLVSCRSAYARLKYL